MTEKKLDPQVLVSVDGGLNGNRRMNLHITVGLLSLTTMLFHFTTVYFFTLQLESLLLVGIFLGLGNFFAFLFDVPIGILQYYFKAKKLFLFGVFSQLIAILIFGNFIFSVTDFLAAPVVNNSGILQGILNFFLSDGINMLLLLVAAACYGFTKEINEITTISYVLSNATPNQYKSIIARNNIFFGIGSFLGLLIAGVILTFSPKLVIFQIVFIILLVFFIMRYFFDNSETTLNMHEVKKFQLYFQKDNLEKMQTQVTQVVSNLDIKKALHGTRYVFLNPIKVSNDMITMSEMVQKTKESFKEIWATLLYAKGRYTIVFWSFTMLLTFGFWDTFASTFLIDFLEQLKPGWSFVLLGIIAIPAFGLQDLFGKIADKIGVHKISMIGLFLSGSSLIVMSVFVSSLNLIAVIGLALINSVGYAICMSLSVATFLESYNITHAERKKLKQIDANASAAPMKILQNLANVVGLTLGGGILSLAGYGGFFLVFGVFILLFLAWSFIHRKNISK
ncbi:MFS transporter [Candidatus Gracilibacteria bacterium]|nr:MFS transporter [Candidatus Gracilibacteria bacterium]